MRHNILGFNQLACLGVKKVVDRSVKTGETKEVTIKLDLIDITILDWMAHFYPKMNKTFVDDKEYVWVSYQKVLDDFPILDISKRAVADRFNKLVELGLLDKHVTKSSNGTYTHFSFTDEYFRLLNSDYTEPTTLQSDMATALQHDLAKSLQSAPKDKLLDSNKLLNNNINNSHVKHGPKTDRYKVKDTPKLIDIEEPIKLSPMDKCLDAISNSTLPLEVKKSLTEYYRMRQKKKGQKYTLQLKRCNQIINSVLDMVEETSIGDVIGAIKFSTKQEYGGIFYPNKFNNKPDVTAFENIASDNTIGSIQDIARDIVANAIANNTFISEF